MRNELIIDDLLKMDRMSVDCLLVCTEFYYNLVALISNKKGLQKNDFINFEIFEMLTSNLMLLAEDLNHEFIYSEKDEMGILVEKNVSATSVAETLEDDLSFDVIRYNHYLLKGNLQEKKSILRKFDTILEPRRDELKSINKKLEDNLFFGLNNLHIRHNNVDSNGNKYYKKYVADMREEELELWYDDIYQLVLLAIMLLNNHERDKKFVELKKKLNDC